MRIEVRPGFDAAVRASEQPIRVAVVKTLRLLQEIEYRSREAVMAMGSTETAEQGRS